MYVTVLALSYDLSNLLLPNISSTDSSCVCFTWRRDQGSRDVAYCWCNDTCLRNCKSSLFFECRYKLHGSIILKSLVLAGWKKDLFDSSITTVEECITLIPSDRYVQLSALYSRNCIIELADFLHRGRGTRFKPISRKI